MWYLILDVDKYQRFIIVSINNKYSFTITDIVIQVHFLWNILDAKNVLYIIM